MHETAQCRNLTANLDAHFLPPFLAIATRNQKEQGQPGAPKAVLKPSRLEGCVAEIKLSIPSFKIVARA